MLRENYSFLLVSCRSWTKIANIRIHWSEARIRTSTKMPWIHNTVLYCTAFFVTFKSNQKELKNIASTAKKSGHFKQDNQKITRYPNQGSRSGSTWIRIVFGS